MLFVLSGIAAILSYYVIGSFVFARDTQLIVALILFFGIYGSGKMIQLQWELKKIREHMEKEKDGAEDGQDDRA